MNYKVLLSTALISSALFLVSCDNDIDLTAPYSEIGVIYGLIDPSDSIHVVRIQKAFLGEGDASQMAQIVDSTYYPDILDVQMHRIKNGSVISSFPLTRFIGDDKDPGAFPSSPNILYKSPFQILFRDSEYRIVVKNTQSGYEFSATSPVVDSLRITRPTKSPNTFIQFSNEAFPYKVEYTSAMNGKITTMTIRFHYTEEVAGSGMPAEQKYLDWKFPTKEMEDAQVLEQVIIEIKGEDFYRYVGDNIPVIPGIIRYSPVLDFIFESGAEVLANYVEINQASSSISTTIPYYSNVVGGTGIFSSRYYQVIPNKLLDAPSTNLLKNGEFTSELGFQ